MDSQYENCTNFIILKWFLQLNYGMFVKTANYSHKIKIKNVDLYCSM